MSYQGPLAFKAEDGPTADVSFAKPVKSASDTVQTTALQRAGAWLTVGALILRYTKARKLSTLHDEVAVVKHPAYHGSM